MRVGMGLCAAAAIVMGAVSGCTSSGLSGRPETPGASPSSAPRASSSSPEPSSPGGAGGIDPCLVGSWVSTGVSGTMKNADATITVPLSGGDGTLTAINPDGVVVTQYRTMAPETGTGSDGGRYAVSFTGSITGRIIASDGHATVHIDDPADATESVVQNGTTVATMHPPAQQESTYSCTPGESLSVSGGGTTTYWRPASPTATTSTAPATESTDPGAAGSGTAVAPGTYKCTAYSYGSSGSGGIAGAGYNLVVGPGNSYRSSRGTDSPGMIEFTDATHFTLRGGFLDGDSGDYVPGPAGHVDYHTPDRRGLFGCYP